MCSVDVRVEKQLHTKRTLEILKGRDHLGDLVLDRSKILKWI
jgi:hypothetical protein